MALVKLTVRSHRTSQLVLPTETIASIISHTPLPPNGSRTFTLSETDADTLEARLSEWIDKKIVTITREVPHKDRTESALKVFVSHSSIDQPIARAFVDLVRAATNIDARDIRCTSVDGYKLEPGVSAEEQLRREVHESAVFVALLSKDSMQSVYVMFELGARWGAGKRLMPVTVGTFTARDLKPPVSAIHAVSGASDADMHQLLSSIAGETGAALNSPAVYGAALAAFTSAAKPHP